MSKMIISLDDHQRAQQEDRCRAALKIIDVPDNVIWGLNGPLLFQMAHLCCVIDQPMHWREALNWMHDHRGEILEHAKKQQQEKLAYEQSAAAATGTNRTVNDPDVEPTHKGQPLRVGDDSVSLGRKKNAAGRN